MGFPQYTNGMLSHQGMKGIQVSNNMVFPTHPPIAQVLPVNPASLPTIQSQHNHRVSPTTDKASKRQKVSEVSDFTSRQPQIPASRASAKVVAPSIVEESKADTGHISTSDGTNPPNECAIIQPSPAKGGIKSISASIAKNYAQNLKEKETLIKQLEQQEESKIIKSDVQDLSLRVQKSVLKEFKPLFDTKESGSIRCICNNSYSCSESILIKCTN